jgi:glucans biosynthesis protein C
VARSTGTVLGRRRGASPPHPEPTTPRVTPPKAVRRHELDWLRVIAVALLFPFHSARVFDVFDPFYVKNAQTSEGLSWVVIRFLDPWHMPLLFVLAGAATWFALGHRTPRAYANERTHRLLVPLLFGLAVIVPPQAYLARLALGRHLSYPGFYADFWRIRGDMNGYTGLWTPAHLWFVLYLFVFSLIALPLFASTRRRAADRPGPRRWPVWSLLVFPFALDLTNGLGEDGPPNPFSYLLLFVAGFVLVSDERVQRVIERVWPWFLAAAIVTMAIALRVWSSGADGRWADGSWQSTTFDFVQAANTWLWVLGLIGAAGRLLRFENRLLRYANEAAYPVYVLHQTVIVAVGYFVIRWDLGIAAKYATVLLVSVAITLLLYEVAVKRTRVTRFLFGLKPKARVAR